MYYSPLRYPGGKRKLANFFKLLFRVNDLVDGDYVEPYAGGAAVALSLLMENYAARIHINDLDRGVYAFWYAVLNNTDALCRRIVEVRIDMETWHRQRAVYRAKNPDPLDLALATFFLNRTNRSGIITGGVIGGKRQRGIWRLDARFNKSDLIQRIQKIARHRSRIHLYNEDAACFIKRMARTLPKRSLFYLDPPYFVKGKSQLYSNYYEEKDHRIIAELVARLKHLWVVSYDDVPEIRALYNRFRCISYTISYSTQDRYRGREVMFFADNLMLPPVKNPSTIKVHQLRQLEKHMCKGNSSIDFTLQDF